MNKPTLLPIETWQFFQACKSYLGSAFLQKLYKVKSRQIDRWCSDPDYTESSQKNPGDRYEAMLTKLMDIGRADIARSSVRRKVRIVGCILEKNPQAIADKDTLPEEMLDDYEKLHLFHQAVLNNEDELVIRKLRTDLFNEIHETCEIYSRHQTTGTPASTR